MRDNPEGGESYPAEGVRRRCKKNSSVLFCIGKRTREAVTVAAKSGQFTVDETGQGQILRGNRRNLAGERERVVRKISSPQKVVSVSNLYNGPNQWARNMGNEESCSGFGKRVGPFISGKSSMTGDPLEAYSSREERESERSQISQKDFGWENAGAEERRVRAEWESVKKRAD